MNCECGRPLPADEAEAPVVNGRRVCATCYDQAAGGGNLPVSDEDEASSLWSQGQADCYEVRLNVIEICLLMGMLGMRLQRGAELGTNRWLEVTGGLMGKLTRAMVKVNGRPPEEEEPRL